LTAVHCLFGSFCGQCKQF